MSDDDYIPAHLRHYADCPHFPDTPCRNHEYCLEQSHAVLDSVAQELADALRELHAMVWGECPSLLEELSGGNARADMACNEALQRFDNLNKKAGA